MEEELKFTQDVKDKWLEALRSGKYIQGTASLEFETSDGSYRHCCLGVLGVIHPGLVNNCNDEIQSTPYEFMENTITKELSDKIWKQNDSTYDRDKPDYSNVIPLIESLPVQE